MSSALALRPSPAGCQQVSPRTSGGKAVTLVPRALQEKPAKSMMCRVTLVTLGYAHTRARVDAYALHLAQALKRVEKGAKSSPITAVPDVTLSVTPGTSLKSLNIGVISARLELNIGEYADVRRESGGRGGVSSLLSASDRAAEGATLLVSVIGLDARERRANLTTRSRGEGAGKLPQDDPAEALRWQIGWQRGALMPYDLNKSAIPAPSAHRSFNPLRIAAMPPQATASSLKTHREGVPHGRGRNPDRAPLPVCFFSIYPVLSTRQNIARSDRG
jgi:hypothetical protein